MSSVSQTWDGNAMTQEDMMIKDTVLVLDNDDNVIGSASKRTSHEFTSTQARGILHRAFSVFLFDESTGELLLQQRASSKITFPNVRTFAGPDRHPIAFTSQKSDPLVLENHSISSPRYCFVPRYGPILVARILFMEWNPQRLTSQKM